MNNAFLSAVQNRRTIYSLGKQVTLSESEIRKLVEHAILQAPCAFGVQPTRVVILFTQHHNQLWNIVKDVLIPRLSADIAKNTSAKIDGFRAAYGSILFFEDGDVTSSMAQRFPTYADKFPDWSMQAQGIALYSVWCALASAGIGASIQHYNPLIDAAVSKAWNIPSSWHLLGQMPFGSVVQPAQPKPLVDINQLVKVV